MDDGTRKASLDFPVVAVGASAGGIEALKTFAEHIPQDPGCAFVILQHLAPDHESQLTAILERSTKLPVQDADHHLAVERNNIYVLPPDRYLRIVDNGLFVEPPGDPRGLRMAIDHFMRSLAESLGASAVGVVLSGTGSDGSVGLREIKSAGGLTLAQSPETALYDGMPSAAIKLGVVDFVGPIPDLVERAVSYVADNSGAGEEEDAFSRQDLQAVVALLKARVGHDFGAYKSGTTARRVARRMSLLRFNTLNDYLNHLRITPNECQQLFHDLLINATGFFRDPDVWPVIQAEVAEKLLRAGRSEPVRVWIPGCSTGEEAYTYAMLFEEVCDRVGADCHWQIFATDLDPDAVAFARFGLYPRSIEADVGTERLKRHFVRENRGYRVAKSLREKVVFAQQNLLGDPPFSRLDLISCRNLMIYLTQATQNRVLDLFHFALCEDGFLILGTSESTGQRQRLFRTVSGSAHVYQRLRGATPRPLGLRSEASGPAPGRILEPRPARTGAAGQSLSDRVQKALLERFAPASIAVSQDGEIAYFHGKVRRFLDTPEGEPSRNLYVLLNPGLRFRVREAIRDAASNERAASHTARATLPDGEAKVRIECERLGDPEQGQFLISLIEEPVDQEVAAPSSGDPEDTEYVRQLEHELMVVREDLQTTVEELETSNEELKASNEEAMAANEELQSTNEELETSREELQSLNEELVTVNSQLEEKIGELESTTSDLGNLFASTRLPVLFLDSELRIRGFTPTAVQVIEVREGDEGRPISDFALKVDDAGMASDARKVLEDLSAVEREIGAADGRIYLRRIQPYRTGDERIDGVVISYADVTKLAAATRRLEVLEQQQRAVAEMGQAALNARAEQPLFDDVCARLQAALKADFVKILELTPDRKGFLLRAGAGWKPGLVGKAHVENSTASQAGYTLVAKEAVYAPDMEQEKRFRPPALLTDHTVRCGLSTVIVLDGEPWGVLGVHGREANCFNREDLVVVRAAANIVSAALGQIRREERLRDERLVLDLAVTSADLAVWRWEASTDRSIWDDRLFRLLGLDARPDPTGELFFSAVDPLDRDRVRNALSKTRDLGAPFLEEFRVHLPDGRRRWLAGRGLRVPGSDPGVVTGVNFDITDRKEAEDRQQVMIRELDHRVKNMLAVILSMSRFTGRSETNLPSFLERFNDRVQAMSRTHSMLSESHWSSLTLRDLLQGELFPYRLGDGANLSLSGPDVRLPPDTGQSLSMAIHELATNAAKYGALRTPKGRLVVRWSRVREDDADWLRLEWREHAEAPVEKPTRIGYGTTVIQRLMAGQVGARVTQDFKPEGMTVVMLIPAERLAPSETTSLGRRPPEIVGDVDVGVLRGACVLVLDDEYLIAQEHAQVLSEQGAKLQGPFTELPTAIRSAARRKPDVAVLDFNIAGKPVTPLARRLADRGVPVIIVTGYGSSLPDPEDLGDVLVLQKPIDPKELVRRVASVLAPD